MNTIVALVLFACHFVPHVHAFGAPKSFVSSPAFNEKPNDETEKLRGSLAKNAPKDFSRRLQLQCVIQQLGDDVEGEAAGDRFATSVSLSEDGRTMAVGAYLNDGNGEDSGHVRVYGYSDGTGWTQVGDDIDGETAGDWSGRSTSLSADGRTVAIGAVGNDDNGRNSGHVRVFGYNDGAGWTQLGDDIDGEADFVLSGESVSLSADGRTMASGAYLTEDGNSTARVHVRVHEYNNETGWLQLGDTIDDEAASYWSGESVSLSPDGTTLAVGATEKHGNGEMSGHVRVYGYADEIGWIQLGDDITGEASGDNLGESVSLSSDGRTVAIGAPFNDGNGESSGHARVYQYNDVVGWVQLGDDIDGEAAGDSCCNSVSLSANGRTMAIGAHLNDRNGKDSGHVQIFSYNDEMGWIRLGDAITGEAADDNAGVSVSLSADGRTVAVGADRNDGNGVDSGHVRVFILDDCIKATAPSSASTASSTSSLSAGAKTGIGVAAIFVCAVFVAFLKRRKANREGIPWLSHSYPQPEPSPLPPDEATRRDVEPQVPAVDRPLTYKDTGRSRSSEAGLPVMVEAVPVDGENRQ